MNGWASLPLTDVPVGREVRIVFASVVQQRFDAPASRDEEVSESWSDFWKDAKVSRYGCDALQCGLRKISKVRIRTGGQAEVSEEHLPKFLQITIVRKKTDLCHWDVETAASRSSL